MIETKQVNANSQAQSKQMGKSGSVPLKQVIVRPAATSTASASIGPFSTNSQKLSVAGNLGPDLVANTTIVVCVELYPVQPEAGSAYTPFSATETIISNCSLSTGWNLGFGTNGALVLGLITSSGAATSFTFPQNLAPGVNRIAITVTAGGAIRISQNGNTPVQLVAAGFSYVNSGASGQFILGGVNTARVASGQPLVDGHFITQSWFNAALSDSDLQAVANGTNLTERYKLQPLESGSSLVSGFSATDWDGSSGTATAGTGTSPTTFTVGGSPTKNTIEAENVYNVENWFFADALFTGSGVYQSGVGTYTLRSPCARMQFTANSPARIGSSISADTLPGSNTNGLGFQCSGLKVNNIPQRLGVWCNEVGLLRTTDWLPGQFDGGGSTYELIDGNQSFVGGARRANSIQSFRLPVSTPLQNLTTDRSSPTKRVAFLGDSIPGGRVSTAPTTACWPMLIRTYMSIGNNGSLVLESVGAWAWIDQAVDSPTITASVARVGALFDGTSSNELITQLGTNDYIGPGSGAWSAATFQTQVAAWFDAFHTAFPGVHVTCITPLSRTTETANSFGNTLTDYRNALVTIASTRAYITIVSGPSLVPLSLVDPVDHVHYDQPGHSYLAYSTAVALGFTPVEPWNSNGLIYGFRASSAWVADSGNIVGSPVSQWNAEIGGIPFVQASGPNQPSFSASAWTSPTPRGGVTFVSPDYMSADALSSQVTGNDKPWRITLSFLPTSLTTTFQLTSFAHSTTATQGAHTTAHVITTHVIRSSRTGDSGAAITLNTTQTLSAAKHVLTFDFDGQRLSIRLDGVVTSINFTSQDTVACTFDGFTIACFKGGGTPVNFAPGVFRHVIFKAVANDGLAYETDEGFILAEMAA